MRTILGLMTLCALMVATAPNQFAGSGDAPRIVTCDGTKTIVGKCENGKIPFGYFESFTCQDGELPPDHKCQNAIAFSVDSFYCTDRELNPTENPLRTTYCYDTKTIVNCTIRKPCSTVLVMDELGRLYVRCIFEEGTQVVTTSLRKGLHSSTTTPPSCEPSR